jgi:hypothetical protein
MVSDHTSLMTHVGNLSLVPTRMKHAPTPGRSLGDQRQTSPAIALGHLILPPSRQPYSRGERFQQVVIQLHQLTGLITPACDRYVQCLLVGANPSVFNTQRRWLQPWSCRLSIYHSRTFPTSGLHFPPKSPAWSQVIQSTITKRSKEGTNHNSHEWETPLDFNHKLSSKHSVC